MINITLTAESQTIADLIALIREMADDLEKTCKKNDDYKQTDLSHGIWSSSHLGEIEYELNDGKRTTLANLFNPDSES